MDSETPIIRYIAGAVGVVLICFCVGYFLLGPRQGSAAPGVVVAEATPAPEPSALVVKGPAPKLTVLETTPSDTPKMEAQRNDTREATPAPTPTPAQEATPAPRPKRGDDEAVQIPPPKTDTPSDTEEVKPADPPADTTTPPTGGPDTVYRVRVKDSFGSHDDADQLASELKGRGFSATVMPAGKGKFEVQIGAYKDKKRAEEKQKELEKNSYRTRITDKEMDLDKSDKSDSGSTGDAKSGEKEAEKAKAEGR